MPAYVIVETNVTDPERYEQYKAAASAAIAARGGRYLARGGELAVLEGDWQPSRLVVPEDRHSLRRTGGTHNIRYSAMRVTSSAAPDCSPFGVGFTRCGRGVVGRGCAGEDVHVDCAVAAGHRDLMVVLGRSAAASGGGLRAQTPAARRPHDHPDDDGGSATSAVVCGYPAAQPRGRLRPGHPRHRAGRCPSAAATALGIARVPGN